MQLEAPKWVSHSVLTIEWPNLIECKIIPLGGKWLSLSPQRSFLVWSWDKPSVSQRARSFTTSSALVAFQQQSIRSEFKRNACIHKSYAHEGHLWTWSLCEIVSPWRYVLKIHFFIESGLKMIQFKIQFKTKSRIFIQQNIHSIESRIFNKIIHS